MEVNLCDKNPDVVKAWRQYFDRAGRVKIHEADVMDLDVSALVLPINSFGILDDGLVERLNRATEGALESRARKMILERHAGEMPVGVAEVMSSGMEKPGLIVLAPVIRVPQRMQGPGLNAYLATRAALRAVAAYIRNGESRTSGLPLESLVFVGMGTGQGGIPPATCAFQMYEAYCQIVLGQVPNFATVEAATAHDSELKKNRFV